MQQPAGLLAAWRERAAYLERFGDPNSARLWKEAIRERVGNEDAGPWCVAHVSPLDSRSMPAKVAVSVFIGWSGPRSRAVALALKEWLPLVIQAAVPWVSEDMDRGVQWFTTIGVHLKGADYGVLCVTPENATEPWVLFEAGALALRTGEGFACPYLLDMTPAALAGPMTQLQAATANQDGTRQMVETINRLLDEGTRLPADRLQKAFDKWWPDLDAKLAAARQVAAAPAAVPARTTDDKLDEILEIARALQRSEGRVFDTSLTFMPMSTPGLFQSVLFDPAVVRKVGGLLTTPPLTEPPEPQPPKASPGPVLPKIGKPPKKPPQGDG